MDRDAAHCRVLAQVLVGRYPPSSMRSPSHWCAVVCAAVPWPAAPRAPSCRESPCEGARRVLLRLCLFWRAQGLHQQLDRSDVVLRGGHTCWGAPADDVCKGGERGSIVIGVGEIRVFRPAHGLRPLGGADEDEGRRVGGEGRLGGGQRVGGGGALGSGGGGRRSHPQHFEIYNFCFDHFSI